jgi:hypothetical protein
VQNVQGHLPRCFEKKNVGVPVYLFFENPRILALEILICLVLEVFIHRLWNEFPNAQAYNHRNATIIRIGIAEEKDDVIMRIWHKNHQIWSYG